MLYCDWISSSSRTSSAPWLASASARFDLRIGQCLMRTTSTLHCCQIYQWFVLDIAFGKPKGWAVGRLERMWMAQGEGGGRGTAALFTNARRHWPFCLT